MRVRQINMGAVCARVSGRQMCVCEMTATARMLQWAT